VRALLSHAGAGCIDTVVVQRPALDVGGVGLDRPALGLLGVEVIEADVSGPTGSHDPGRLAAVLEPLR
jgi:hypothetical protein